MKEIGFRKVARVAATEFRQKLTYQQGQNFWGYEVHRDERKKYENRDNDSNNGRGVTVYGVRPDNGGATTDAGADEGTADYCASEREENASRSGAEQTAGKT